MVTLIDDVFQILSLVLSNVVLVYSVNVSLDRADFTSSIVPDKIILFPRVKRLFNNTLFRCIVCSNSFARSFHRRIGYSVNVLPIELLHYSS